MFYFKILRETEFILWMICHYLPVCQIMHVVGSWFWEFCPCSVVFNPFKMKLKHNTLAIRTAEFFVLFISSPKIMKSSLLMSGYSWKQTLWMLLHSFQIWTLLTLKKKKVREKRTALLPRFGGMGKPSQDTPRVPVCLYLGVYILAAVVLLCTENLPVSHHEIGWGKYHLRERPGS